MPASRARPAQQYRADPCQPAGHPVEALARRAVDDNRRGIAVQQILVVTPPPLGIGKHGIDGIQFPHLIFGDRFQGFVGLLIGVEEAREGAECVANLFRRGIRCDAKFLVEIDFAGTVERMHEGGWLVSVA